MRNRTQAFINIMKTSVVSACPPFAMVCVWDRMYVAVTITEALQPQHPTNTHKHFFPISLSHTDRPLLRDSGVAKLHNMNNVISGHQLSSSKEGNE